MRDWGIAEWAAFVMILGMGAFLVLIFYAIATNEPTSEFVMRLRPELSCVRSDSSSSVCTDGSGQGFVCHVSRKPERVVCLKAEAR